MLNLFRMEIYRALKSKVTGITLLVMGALSFFTVFAGTMGSDNNDGINICQQFTGVISNPMLVIIWAVMISVYIAGEYKNGFVKSIAGQVANRGSLAVSKLLLFMVYTIVMFTVSFISVSIAALIFSKGNFMFGFTSQMIVLWSVQLLLYVAFSSIYILISTFTRSSGLGIALGIFTGCGLTSVIYTGISWLVNKSGIVTNFNFGSYMVEINMQYMQVGIPQEYILRAVLIGLVFVIVMTFASIQILNKRDID